MPGVRQSSLIRGFEFGRQRRIVAAHPCIAREWRCVKSFVQRMLFVTIACNSRLHFRHSRARRRALQRTLFSGPRWENGDSRRHPGSRPVIPREHQILWARLLSILDPIRFHPSVGSSKTNFTHTLACANIVDTSLLIRRDRPTPPWMRYNVYDCLNGGTALVALRSRSQVLAL